MGAFNHFFSVSYFIYNRKIIWSTITFYQTKFREIHKEQNCMEYSFCFAILYNGTNTAVVPNKMFFLPEIKLFLKKNVRYFQFLRLFHFLTIPICHKMPLIFQLLVPNRSFFQKLFPRKNIGVFITIYEEELELFRVIEKILKKFGISWFKLICSTFAP